MHWTLGTIGSIVQQITNTKRICRILKIKLIFMIRFSFFFCFVVLIRLFTCGCKRLYLSIKTHVQWSSTGLFPLLLLFLFRQPFDHFDAKQTSYEKKKKNERKKGTPRLKQMTTTRIENL